MTAALRSQLKWSTTGTEINLLSHLNFLRPLVNLYNTWRMDRYLNPQLDNRYKAVLDKHTNSVKSVIDLALNAYLSENPSAPADSIPKAFKDAALSQIKLFIFAGHDTTSSAAIFTYDLLSRHPDILARVRAEHDAVLGPEPSQAPATLASTPQILNQLPYTVAVIKEAFRMYPTVAALRIGQPNFSLVSSETGQRFPTEGFNVLGDHYGVHHNPKVWLEPEKFLPERWLAAEGDSLYPKKNAWRPFERGPRNCIGMELAMTEIKIILALTIRSFDIKNAYDEHDALKGNPKGLNVNGQRTYMVRATGGGTQLMDILVRFHYLHGDKAKIEGIHCRW